MFDIIRLKGWHSPKALNRFGLEEKDYPYTTRKRNQLINKILEGEGNIMLQGIIPSEGEKLLIIYVDMYRFHQR